MYCNNFYICELFLFCMSGPLETVLGFFVDGDPLFEIEATLDDVLNHLAFDNIDRGVVAGAKWELRKYRGFFARLGLRDREPESEFPVVVALAGIENAYHEFMVYQWGPLSESERVKLAEQTLVDSSFIGSDTIPMECEIRRIEGKNPEITGGHDWRNYSNGSFDLFARR